MPTLLKMLQKEQNHKISGGIYHKIQIHLTYNSNHIEGSRLTQEQTRHIYETNSLLGEGESIYVDDILETAQHFRCIDLMIREAKSELTQELIKKVHFILKSGTSQADFFAVGDYKTQPNEVGGRDTTAPEDVPQAVVNLLSSYNNGEQKTLEELLEFHHDFEAIYPFQDGNGRVGRLILFKECLNHDIIPFVIDESLKLFYYRGLSQWNQERGYLRDTCLTAQDSFKKWLDYYRISYEK